MLLAFLFGYALVRWRAVRLGISGRHIDNVSLLIPPLSLFGARFFSWLFYMPAGIGFWEGMTMDGGGLVFYGGLIFAALTVVIYTLARKIPLREMADACAAPVMLGLAIGRIGCFMAGCCWGDICAAPQSLASVTDPHVSFKIQTFPALSPAGFPLAVTFPQEAGAFEQHVKLKLILSETAHSLPVHPVQLYEAGLAFLFCFLLHHYFQKRRYPGDIFWVMMIGYGLIRFTTEFFRGDNSPAYWGLTISQVISVLFFVVGGGALLFRARPTFRPALAMNRAQ